MKRVPLHDGLKMKNGYIFIVVNEKSTFFYGGRWKGCLKISYWSVKRVFYKVSDLGCISYAPDQSLGYEI